MATTEKTFETIPVGTDVTWHYRSAIGHGTVIGVHKIGSTADNTMYSVRQHDHHPGEPAILHHSGKALSIVKSWIGGKVALITWLFRLSQQDLRVRPHQLDDGVGEPRIGVSRPGRAQRPGIRQRRKPSRSLPSGPVRAWCRWSSAMNKETAVRSLANIDGRASFARVIIVRRLLDPHYGSKLPRIAKAMSWHGQRLVIAVEPAWRDRLASSVWSIRAISS
jgi:hypothetical protein